MPTGFLLIAAVTGVLIAGIEIVWRTVGEPRGLPHEAGRKAHHIGIGLIATAVPSLIDSPALAVVLSLGFGGLLLAFYKSGHLRSFYKPKPTEGDPVFRRFQHSWIGPATYSFAVAVLAYFFWGRPVIYRASVLILSLGDSAATVFGAWLGRDHYLIFGTRRSLAGNTALLLLASLVCAGTLAPTGALERALTVDVVATAVLFGLLLALTETISPFGLDNLTLPLMSAVVMLSLVDARGGFAITGDTVLAFGLVSGTALLFTAAHLQPRYLNRAALMLGMSTIVLFEMQRYLFVAILLIFLACALFANELARRQELAHHHAGAAILGQVAPCVLFMGLHQMWPSRGMAVGSLACVVVLAARCWVAELGIVPGPAGRSRVASLALQAVASSVGAVGGVLAGTAVDMAAGPGERVVLILQVVAAAALGGLATAFVVRPSESEGDSFLSQVVPGMLAVSVIPAVATLVMGLVG